MLEKLIRMHCFQLIDTFLIVMATDIAYPAHAAASQGNAEVLQMLVERGSVGVNDRNEKGATPAHKGRLARVRLSTLFVYFYLNC